MTPKEKAKELYLNLYKHNSTVHAIVRKNNTKLQALICVDEILNLPICFGTYYPTCMADVEYWNEVKQEIEKL